MHSNSRIYEIDMLPVILQSGNSFGKDLDHAVEISTGFGVADVLFYKLQNGFKRREGFPSYDLAKVLTWLSNYEDNRINITTFNTILSGAKEREHVVDFLLEHNYLKVDKRNDAYIRNHEYLIGLEEVVAIEAKLSNWKRGLYQAYRYKQMSNYSYVALDEQYIHRAIANIHEFERSGVGLIEVKDRNIVVHYSPTRRELKKNVFTTLTFERLLNTSYQ